MIRFLRRPRLTAGAGLFAGFALVALLLTGPKVAEGFRRSAPPLPALRPIVGPAAVIDGDTFRIGRETIRLWGVDAPEAGTPEGAAATAYLRTFLVDHQVTCRQAGAPSYGRVVARCADPWGRDVAEVMVSAGWALDWPAFSQARYRAAQASAAARGLGMHGGGFRSILPAGG